MLLHESHGYANASQYYLIHKLTLLLIMSYGWNIISLYNDYLYSLAAHIMWIRKCKHKTSYNQLLHTESSFKIIHPQMHNFFIYRAILHENINNSLVFLSLLVHDQGACKSKDLYIIQVFFFLSFFLFISLHRASWRIT